MALIVADRVLESSTTTGTGSYTLGGAITGYRTAASVCVNNDMFSYYAEDVDIYGRPLGSWETGLGTWTTGNILVRTTIYASSNANAAVSWAAGTRRIGLSVNADAALKSLNLGTVADTATAASHYMVEIGSDGLVRPKTLANVKAEILASPTLTGAIGMPSNGGNFEIKTGTGDGASTTVYNTTIRSWYGIGFRDYQDLTTVKAYIDCRSGIFAGTQLQSLVATGTAPLVVASTTKVTNLNADLLDGIDSTQIIYGNANNCTNNAPTTWQGTHITSYKSGFWDVTNGAWAPKTTGWYWGLTMAHTSNSSSYLYGAQITIGLNDNDMYFRGLGGGATPNATAWKRVSTADESLMHSIAFG